MKSLYKWLALVVLFSTYSQPCPNFDSAQWFQANLFQLCLPFNDVICVSKLPWDAVLDSVNCRNMPPRVNNQLEVLNQSEYQSLIDSEDEFGRNWCVVAIFFKKNCIFSEKAMPIIANIARYFPQLRVVGTDVYSYNKVSKQYVYASSPTIFLLQNGYGALRIPTKDITLQSVVKKVMEYSDLDLSEEVKEQVKKNVFPNYEEQSNGNRHDTVSAIGDEKFMNIQYVLAWPTSILCGVYLYLLTEKGKRWRDLLYEYVRPLEVRLYNFL